MPVGQSLNDFVSSGQDRLRDPQPERLGGFEIDHQLELRGLLDGQIAGLRALEDAIDVARRSPKYGMNVRAVRHEPAHVDELAPTKHRRQALPRGQFNDAGAVHKREGMSEYEQRVSSLACGLREERLEI